MGDKVLLELSCVCCQVPAHILESHRRRQKKQNYDMAISLEESWKLERMYCWYYVGHGSKGHGHFRGTENYLSNPGSGKFPKGQVLKLRFAHGHWQMRMLLELHQSIRAFYAWSTALVRDLYTFGPAFGSPCKYLTSRFHQTCLLIPRLYWSLHGNRLLEAIP